jgi:hypothetical protein
MDDPHDGNGGAQIINVFRLAFDTGPHVAFLNPERMLSPVVLAAPGGEHPPDERGGAPSPAADKTMTETVVDPEFWDESFQKWQSEYLSTPSSCAGHPPVRTQLAESKPVRAPHVVTGTNSRWPQPRAE